MSELMTFSLINKKVVTNDMQSVTTMAQMWGFRPLKAKAFFGTPAGHRNSPPDCFYPLDCPVRIPLFIFGADVGIRTPEASLKTYTISNRAPSASSDTSAYLML